MNGVNPQTESRTEQQLAAQRWAKSQAVRFPGIVFSAIIGGQIFSYEANKHGHWQALDSFVYMGRRAG